MHAPENPKGLSKFRHAWFCFIERGAVAIPPALLFFIPLTATVLLTAVSFRTGQRELRSLFDQQARRISTAVELRMSVYENAIWSTRAFFAGSETVTRKEFREFVSSMNLKTEYPGIRGLGYATYAKTAQIRAVEREMRRDGVEHFVIDPPVDSDENPNGEHVLVQYLEPNDPSNSTAFGYDMNSEPERHEAMALARDTGATALTPLIPLRRTTDGVVRQGFVMYAPLYLKQTEVRTIGDRHRHIQGFIYAAFRVDDLFTQIMKEAATHDTDIGFEVTTVRDPKQTINPNGPHPELPLFSSLNFDGIPPSANFISTFEVEVAGMIWKIKTHGGPFYDSANPRTTTLAIFFGGLLVSFLLYRLACMYHDSILRSREDKRLIELVNSIGLSLRADLDVESLAQKVVELAIEATQSDRGAFYLVEKRDTQRSTRLIATSSASHGHSDSVFDTFPIGQVEAKILKRESASPNVLVLHRTTEPAIIDAWFHNAEILSCLVAPLRSRGEELLGIMIFTRGRPTRYSERAERVIAGIAAQAAVALENAHLIEALKSGERGVRKIAEENQKLYREAQTANRAKDEFLATISHELRTPLNVIQGHAELLKLDPTGIADVDDAVDAIYRNARAQTQIVNDLLDVSSIITGKLMFEPVPVLIDDVIESAVESIRFAATAKSIRVVVHSSSRGARVKGDPTRLKQILWNLLSNSLKFTSNSGQIEVTSVVTADRCEIKVKDSGQGIQEDFLPYVFERFRQEDNSMTRRYGGLGLGLSIVRNLVDLHGGVVTAHSEGRDRGAEFTVSLPLFKDAKQRLDL